jgi:hypothetical protein
VEIDMSGVRDKPEMPGRSSALEQNLRIGRSGVAIVLAAHDKDWAIHCRKSDRSDAIAKAKRQSAMQLHQKERRKHPADWPEIISVRLRVAISIVG